MSGGNESTLSLPSSHHGSVPASGSTTIHNRSGNHDHGSDRKVKLGEEHADESAREEDLQAGSYLSGWRLYCSVTGVLLATFLAMMEASVVATALVGITNDLQDFKTSAWIVNAYLVTFTSFMLIWIQFSHVMGRRALLAVAFCIFIAFSGACAGAQTSFQLIIFRAFQGIGGAGVSNISTVLLGEMAPPSEWPKHIAMVSVTFAFAYGVGPLIGGAIVSYTSWRWIFWINVPAAVLTLIFMLLSLPPRFPHHHDPHYKRNARASAQRLDLSGGFLFLGGAVLLVTAFQGAGVDWEWSSATSICLLVFAGVGFVLFALWERRISLSTSTLVPLFTWKFAKRRPIALFLSFLLTAFPFNSTTVALTERFQIVDGLGAFEAGVRLLPFIVVNPLVSVFGALVVARLKIKHAYALLVGVAFQLIGLICFITAVPDVRNGPPSVIYGFQVLLATGLGINNTLVTTAVPFMVDKSLAPTAMGTGMQFRYLGAALGLGTLTAVFNSRLRVGLSEILSPSQLATILESTAAVKLLPTELQEPVREVFFQSFRAEWMTSIGFVAAQVPVALALL